MSKPRRAVVESRPRLRVRTAWRRAAALLLALLLAVLTVPGLVAGSVAWAQDEDAGATASAQPAADPEVPGASGDEGTPDLSPAPGTTALPDTPVPALPNPLTPKVTPEGSPDLGQSPDPASPPEVASPVAGPQADAVVAAADASASLALTVTQKTGTAPFQDDDAAGNDSGPDNAIIRTNDTITYRLGIRYEGSDQTAPTVRFTVPKGQSLVSLPPFCLAPPVSSVTPTTLPAPAVPLTADSWTSLPVQQVVCVLADQSMGSAFNYEFLTQVRPEVPHGTAMDPIEFAVSSDQVATPVTISPERVTVSAAAKFDLSKRASEADVNRGPLFQSSVPCRRDSSAVCRTMAYPVSITVPVGGRGTTPLASPITFEDNLDPASFYGAEVWAAMVVKAGSEAAAKQTYAPSFRSCSKITHGSGFASTLPYSGVALGDYANETNAVRDSGVLTCNPGAPGENGIITITNADTSAVTYPSTSGTGNALPANLAHVVSFELGVEVPQVAVLEFGDTESNGSYVLAAHNAYTVLDAKGIDGADNTDDPSNNARDALIRIDMGGSFDKTFSGIFGTEGNTPAGAWWPNTSVLEGPPGSGLRRDGNTVVMPGQSVQSVLYMSQNGAAGSGQQNTVVSCDVWDPQRLALAAHPDWQGAYGIYPSNGKPVYPVNVYSGVRRPPSWIDAPGSGITNMVVEYSSGAFGAGAGSDCSTGAWTTNPDDVPGAVKATDAQGRTTWQGVNRVRVTWVSNFPAGTTWPNNNMYLAIGQAVLDADDEAPIGNWGSQMYTDGAKTAAEVIADPNHRTRVPTYDPATHRGNIGDRLWQGQAIVRIAKYIENPTTGEFVSGVAPQYTSGSPIRYRLNPSLSTSVPVQGTTYPVIVEDCLPRFQVFDASEQGGAAFLPEVVQMGAPAGSELSCPADRQYLRWNLGDREIGKPIEPIVVAAEILEVARNGSFSNEAIISSPADPISPLALRSDDVQLQLVVPTGIKIAKTVDPGVVEVNPAAVQTPRTLKWSVVFANIDSPTNISNVDVIDVLPANGLNDNAFHGSLRFDSATAGDGITVLYTKTAAADLASAPSDASNLADGATVWCDAPSGGAVVSGSGTASDCPQANAEVTGLRFQRAGEFTPVDSFQVDIAMTPIGNHSGDRYVNISEGKAEGVTQGVGPARRAVSVIASEIGDRVWNDKNGNGIQDAGEPGMPDVPVALTGTDVDGNPVDLTTATGPDGTYSFAELASGTYRVTFDIAGLTGFVFTEQGAGNDPAVDSNADPATGKTAEFTLGKDAADLTIDAGVVQRIGGLIIHKQLEGAGVASVGAQDEFTFHVVCTLGEATVFEDTVTLAANGQTSVTSEELTPIPATAVCVVTETSAGNADAVPDPVTVTIPWDPEAGESGTVTASLTNYYSAGTVSLTKKLDGSEAAVNAAAGREFGILVTCQIDEGGVRTDLYSRLVTVTGGSTVPLLDATGEPVRLPLGARCFGQEVHDGGAVKVVIDHDSFENGAEVVAGTPQELQQLVITAVNTFEMAEFTVSKKVVGPARPGIAFDFEVTCTFTVAGEDGVQQVAYPLAPEDARFSLQDRQSRTIAVLSGTSCAVTEVNVPDRVRVTVEDTDDSTPGGRRDGKLADLVGTDNAVAVTNTFPKPDRPDRPDRPGKPGEPGQPEQPGEGGGNLPITGADSLVIAMAGLALLATGVVTTGLVRRRRT